MRLVTSGGRDRAIAAVLEALESGVRPNWLLVYDNVAEPLDLQRYLPTCRPGGHVIITSRLQTWPGYIEADSIEVLPFTEEEAVSFLRRRVPALAADRTLREKEDEQRESRGRRLAAALGHLPIAIEHAAAYLTETGQSVDDYLSQFDQNAHRLLSEQLPELPESVSRTWAMSTALLTPDAEHLFNLCAFFSPEPIAGELLLENAHAVSDPPGLREFLSSSPRFRAAASQMHRLSLVKVDGARDQIQMHRVVQAVTRGQLRQTGPTRSWRTGRPRIPCWPSRTRVTPTGPPTTRSTTCRCSTSSPIAASCTPAIRRCAASSSTRCEGCTCAAAMPRRPGSGRRPSRGGGSSLARRTSRC